MLVYDLILAGALLVGALGCFGLGWLARGAYDAELMQDPFS